MARTVLAAAVLLGNAAVGCQQQEAAASEESARVAHGAVESESASRVPDGTHGASVEYFNPTTGHSATYTLDVEVQDGQVVEIEFPKGGWLDGTHINPVPIDENGDAEVEDDQRRSYSVHLEPAEPEGDDQES